MQFVVRQMFSSVGKYLQMQFQSWGIRTQLSILPEGEFYNRLRAGSFDLFVTRWGCDTGDAMELLENCFYTENKKKGFGLTNYTHYSSPEIDAVIDNLATTVDPDERFGLLTQTLSQISSQYPWVPLFINHNVYAV